MRGEDDAKYVAEEKTTDWWNKQLFSTFIPEAIVQSIMSLPFTMCLAAPEVLLGNQPLPGNPGWQIANAAGVFLFSAGFALEAGADWQLEGHKRARTNGLLRSGVWSIVRHPKYVISSSPLPTRYNSTKYITKLTHTPKLSRRHTNPRFLPIDPLRRRTLPSIHGSSTSSKLHVFKICRR